MIKVKQVLTVTFCLAVMFNIANATLAEDTKLTKEEAMTIATSTVDAKEVGPITSVELETEDGILVYTVEFTKDGTETDVKIDAQTGAVVIVEDDLTEMENDGEGEAEEKEKKKRRIMIIN